MSISVSVSLKLSASASDCLSLLPLELGRANVARCHQNVGCCNDTLDSVVEEQHGMCQTLPSESEQISDACAMPDGRVEAKSMV